MRDDTKPEPRRGLGNGPKDLERMAARHGLTLSPVRMKNDFIFFIKRGSDLLFDGESFDQDELREWLEGKGDEKK